MRARDYLKITDSWWTSALAWLVALVLAVSWGGILYLMGTAEKSEPPTTKEQPK